MNLTPQQIQIIIHAAKVEVLQELKELHECYEDEGKSMEYLVDECEEEYHEQLLKSQVAAKYDWEKLRDRLKEKGIEIG